ncbi:hypothetical protein T552_03388 [Pneumocystis carinii B80]|uniref:DNA replication ATP-dependent helicase/nuclease n=1 Tax=Pneumocystis carinii (strain B80) TaxID=1408658 RepID=A0A0W4ZBI4_PNEC8|nr:hypothetical protein T552_03388 [Pneumocystis carinii B80]KTW25775.1 hypothetical protein T552_03388 [Pneumocystis carinii B80]
MSWQKGLEELKTAKDEIILADKQAGKDEGKTEEELRGIGEELKGNLKRSQGILTPEQKVLWKMSPIRESQGETRQFETVLSLFKTENDEEKYNEGLDPAINLWKRYETSPTDTIDAGVIDKPLNLYEEKGFSLFETQKVPATRKKRTIRNIEGSDELFMQKTRNSMEYLVNKLKAFLPEPWKRQYTQESDVYVSSEEIQQSEETIEQEMYSKIEKDDEESFKKEEMLFQKEEILFDEIEEISKCFDEDIKENEEEIEGIVAIDSILIENQEEMDKKQEELSLDADQVNIEFLKNYTEKKNVESSVKDEVNELCENFSLEADLEQISFSDDILEDSFTDDMLDEDIEAVFSALDTCEGVDIDKFKAENVELDVAEEQCIFEKSKNEISTLYVENEISSDDYSEDISLELNDLCNDEKNHSFLNYKVCNIKEEPWIDSNGYKWLQKVVLNEENQIILLRQDWFFTPIEIGDYLYLHGEYDENGICIVDNSHSLVILNPDFLVSCTSVATSYSCTRRIILQEKVKLTDDISKSQIYGKILHCLFQLCLENDNFSLSFLKEKTKQLVLDNIEHLDISGESIESAMKHISGKFFNLQKWASKYFLNTQDDNSYIKAFRSRTSNPCHISVNKLLRTEEHILSPKYGLKGYIDVSVQLAIKSDIDLQYSIAPLELKTGNNIYVMQHRAQTILYTLLLSEHYGENVDFGLLFYLEKGEVIQVFPVHDEIRGLIIARNNIARYLKNNQELPPMLKNMFVCKKCPMRNPCFVFHKAIESGTAETSGLGEYFNDETSDITSKNSNFFRNWDFILSKEENEIFRLKKELWTMTSKEREKHGRCLSNLKIKKIHSISEEDILKHINHYIYTLEKCSSSNNDYSLLDSEIGYNDFITVSDENGHYALAYGTVINIEPKFITVLLDQQLYNPTSILRDHDIQYTQISKSSMLEVFKNDFNEQDDKDILYRIDKDEFKTGITLARDNLTKLLYLKQEKRRRELIINLYPPKFSSILTDFFKIPEYEKLNNDQKKAISKVMTALDYTLILGMPGTGKTTTITYLIQFLIANNNSILLASYTHSAIDNILLKLNVEKENVLRLGSIERIHPDLRKKIITEEYVVNDFESFQLKYIKPSIVATTCLGITHSIFSKRTFDYCIIDEASQIILPICIGPLRFSKKFVLVGDHYQLPPLVRSIDIANQDIEMSLFKHLLDANPSATVNLEYQYRMNKDIMLLSNTLIYNGKLKCGDEKIAYKLFDCGDFQMLDALHSKEGHEFVCNINECWIKKILEPRLSVVFANTDYVPAPESRKGDRIQNEIEVQLLKQVIICLLNQGISESDIAVLSVYRSQIKLIKHHFRQFQKIEIDTADRFQGRDKNCIIISFVRSNDKNEIGELLRDWRRLNVAFTRAKLKLIFFGSKSTLQKNGLFNPFFHLLKQKQWIYHLPKNAHLLHFLDHPTNQTILNKSSKKKSFHISANNSLLKTIINAL